MGGPIQELGGRTWEELEVQQHESGRLMFPDRLRRRNAKGAVVEEACCVWVPTPADQVAARVAARQWFSGLKGLDPDRDKDLFDEMEQVCLLARAIRTAEPPHSQLRTHEELVEVDEACLHDIQERINAYKALIDPRDAVVDDDAFWRLVFKVVREATLLPLTEFAGHVQPSLVVRMALEASRSPTAQSWLQSSVTSTPAPTR